MLFPSLRPSSVHQVADTDVVLRWCSQRRPGAKAATREPCLANADDVVLEVPTAWRLKMGDTVPNGQGF